MISPLVEICEIVRSTHEENDASMTLYRIPPFFGAVSDLNSDTEKGSNDDPSDHDQREGPGITPAKSGPLAETGNPDGMDRR